MKTADLKALLLLKRVREQRAAAELETARRATDEAVAVQDGAARAVRAFGVLRKAQEGAIFRRLSGDTLGAGRLLAASNELAELVAREGALGQRVSEATRQVRERQRLAEAARTEYRARQRRAESLQALHKQVHEAARGEAESAQERAIEDLAAPADRRR